MVCHPVSASVFCFVICSVFCSVFYFVLCLIFSHFLYPTCPDSWSICCPVFYPAYCSFCSVLIPVSNLLCAPSQCYPVLVCFTLSLSCFTLRFLFWFLSCFLLSLLCFLFSFLPIVSPLYCFGFYPSFRPAYALFLFCFIFCFLTFLQPV